MTAYDVMRCQVGIHVPPNVNTTTIGLHCVYCEMR